MSIINHHIHESIYGILRLCCDGNAEVVTYSLRHRPNEALAELLVGAVVQHVAHDIEQRVDVVEYLKINV